MACYDRRFLVPYLEDVCSIELLCAKLERDIKRCNADISSQTEMCNRKVEDPHRPQEGEFYEGCYGNLGACIPGGIIMLIAVWVIGKLGSFAPLFKVVGWIGFAFGALMCIMGIADIVEQCGYAKKRYYEALQRYEEITKRNAEFRKSIPGRKDAIQKNRNNLSALHVNYSDATRLRERVYGVNIIPRQYRNIYAAYYLYDFFSTGRENDLEKVIQTFVLEEIKQRLDKIIIQNEEIILNQRVQTALQEQQNRAIAENHRQQMRQLAAIESNQELQLDYQRMIETNQEVTNFILAADYYRKYH